MTDLVKRLRRYSYQGGTGDEQGQLIGELVGDMHEAADEIERLRAALQYIAEFAHPDFPVGDLEGELDRAEKIWLQFQNVAQFALREDEG